MIAFGNYKYIIYIVPLTVLIVFLFIFYLYWKKKIISLHLKEGVLREELIIGSGRVSGTKAGIIIVSLILAAFVLLRPQWGEKVRQVNSEGSDVLIALDVSNSMLAKDIKPSRLDRAKDAVRWIARSLKGDRIGLILFAGDAFLQCPLTNDTGAFMMFLDSAAPDSVNIQGTSIGGALDEAYKVFKKKRLTSRMFVLITDGEDHEGNIDSAIGKFKELDVSVYTVGIGRDKGDFIPVGDNDRSGDIYFRDDQGKLIRTRKNPHLLKKLAGSTGGAYIDISHSLSGLKFILEVISDQQKNRYGSRIVKERKEQFAVFGLILAMLLTFELIITERKE